MSTLDDPLPALKASDGMIAGPVVVVREEGRTPLHLLVREPIEVGRDCCGVLIADPQVSRRHVVLRADGGRIVVEDLGSTNGTTIDGAPLDRPIVLRPGQVVRLGTTTIELAVTGKETMASMSKASGSNPDLRATSIDLVAAAAAEDAPSYSNLLRDSGTVTIVFSDIESSTERAVALGDDAWMRLLEVHNSIVRRQVARHRGTEVKAQGDGFMLSFPSARAAVQCMSEVQRALATHARSNPGMAIRIRVGIHTGEVIVGDDGDLFGKHVVLAARIANCASGGEILVSSLVREIVEARGDLRFGDSRTVELKGLGGAHTVHPLVWTEP